MNDEDFNKIKDINDLTEEVLRQLTLDQAEEIRARFGSISKSQFENDPVELSPDAIADRLNKIEKKAIQKIRDQKSDPT